MHFGDLVLIHANEAAVSLTLFLWHQGDCHTGEKADVMWGCYERVLISEIPGEESGASRALQTTLRGPPFCGGTGATPTAVPRPPCSEGTQEPEREKQAEHIEQALT